MDTELKRWVDDELYQVVGMSDPSLVSFVVSMAKNCRTPDELLGKLHETDDNFQINVRTKTFAVQLLDKIPKPAAKPVSAGRFQQLTAGQKRALEFEKLNARLAPLEESDSDEEIPVVKTKGKKSEKPTKNLRKREKSSSEDEVVIPKKTVRKESRKSGSDDEEQDSDKDAKERDEFASRIKEHDKKKTRKIVSKSEAKASAEAAKRLNIAESTDNKTLIKSARYESRKQYLGKRKEDKIYELRRMAEEEEHLIPEEELTEIEKHERKYNREILKYVDEFDKAGDVLKKQRYYVPDATTKVVPTEYVEEEDFHGGDGRKWENERMSAAVFQPGAKDRIKTDFSDELLLEDEIDFVQTIQIPGTEDDKKPQISELQKRKMSIQETRRSLPVYAFREMFIEAVKEHQILIIEGETGSGKTTQLPQYLYEAGFCKDKKRIGCTQPRRVAAMSVAARVAEEMGTKLGGLVGYSIRFEDCTSERTMLKYMTDGMLLREFLNEPNLESYSVMMIDEAHERTLHTDILFGLVKDIARFRPDFKLLISSATLDADKFSRFFDDAPIFRIPGRRFPVDIFYTKAPEADYCDAAVITVLQIHLTQPLPGDILVFLTGQEEIELVQEALQERIKMLGSKIKELIVLPIYANLPSDMQVKIFEPTPPNSRKVVLATNIAETSVTIDGINYVIDPGMVKQNSYDARSRVEYLNTVTVSKAAANQRAGRAGRTGPGKCFRLYTAWSYMNELEDQPIPEIQRTNLGNVVLMLMSLGIYDLVHFDFLDPPPHETLVAALEHLYALGAVNHKGVLTKLGRRMAEFPCDPAMSKMILASETYNCTEEIITISAMLSLNAAIFYRPKSQVIHADTARKGFWSPFGDHLTLLNVYNRWKETNFSTQWCMENFIQARTMKRARDIREQLEGLLERVEIEPKSSTDPISIRKAIAAGYFYNLAKLDKGGSYKTVKHRHTTQIHPNSSLFEERPRWLVYYELVFTAKEFMREVVEIDSAWMKEVAPHYYKMDELEDSTNKKMPKQQGKSKIDLDR